MTKTSVPLRVDDVTGFTRLLSKQLGEKSPSHLTMMNMVAKAAGYQNFQHMRAACAAEKRLHKMPDARVADARTVERTLNQFDDHGRLRRWPSRRAVQTLALWALWATFPAQKSLQEKEVNRHLAQEHLFEDVATLRRTMIACGLMTRQRDGSDYRRVEQEPPVEAKAVFRALRARRAARDASVAEKNDA